MDSTGGFADAFAMLLVDNGPVKFNWEDIRYFLEVSRAKSVSEAGAKLGVSHTTVVRRIKALETGLSAQLFEKKPTGYKLTEAGLLLTKYAQNIEADCLSLQELVLDESARATGTVRLSVPEGFGCHFLPHHLAGFFRKHPGIELEIIAQPQSLSVSKREAHISITAERPSVGHLIASMLSDYSMQLFASGDYLARHPPVRSMEDLKDHDLVATRHPMDSPDMRFGDHFVPTFDARLRFRSINAQVAAVRAGLGISLIPCYMAARCDDLVPVLPKKVRVERAYWLCMHEDTRKVQRVRAVWEWLKEIVETDRAILRAV